MLLFPIVSSNLLGKKKAPKGAILDCNKVILACYDRRFEHHHRLQFLVQREDLFEAVLAERHRVHSQ